MPEPTKSNHQSDGKTDKLYKRSSGELAQLIAELQSVNSEIQESRRAALNVMEDAILSKEALRKSEEKYRLELEQKVRERTAELKASQEQYASLVENTPDIITRWNKDLKLIFANSAFIDKTGVSLEQLYGKTNLEMGQPSTIAIPYMESLHKVFETGEAMEHFNSFPTSQGEVSYFSRIVPERNEEGEVETVLSIARDITEYKKANEQIREQTHYIKRITETVPDMISVTNLQTQEFTYLNKEIFKAQGFDPDEMNARNAEERIEYVHPNDRPVLAEYFEKFSTASDDDVITLEYRAKGSSGRWDWFVVRGRVFQRNETGVATHVLNVIENITDRKQAEYDILRLKDDVARKATDKYLRLYHAIDEAFCLLEVMYNEKGKMYDMRFLDVNPAVEKQLAVKVEPGKTFSDYPGLNIHKFQQCADVVHTGVPVRFIDHSPATNRWHEYHAVRIGSEADRQVGLLFNDITEHKRNEQNHALLSEISQELFGLSSTKETMGRLGEKIGKHFGITQCTFIELSDDGEIAMVIEGWNAHDARSLMGPYRTRDFLSAEQIAANMAGQPTIVDDTQNDARVNAENYGALGIHSFIINPLMRDRTWRFMLAVIDNKPRHWREDEIDLVREITGRIWTRLERARAEQALRESEAKLKATMDSAMDYAIITTTTEGIIERWNSGAEKIFGYTPDEITGKSADIIFTPEDRDNDVPAKEMETAREKGKANDERWHLRKDGSQMFVSGVMAPIYDGLLAGYVKVARDITERQLIEQQKDEFITIASHELKTPATTIKAYSEYLNEISEEQGNEEIREPVAKLNTQVDRLISLIHALLDTTRIVEGQLKLNAVTFDLNTLITDQVEALQRTTYKHRLALNLSKSAIITADRERVAQVLTNLVSNAIKYSPQKGDITITSKKTKEGVQVSVQDKGIGIPKQSLDKIFGRFYRVRNPQVDTFPGMGLGLYIAASIIQQHRGKIWVESRVDKGTTFYFLLPYN